MEVIESTLKKANNDMQEHWLLKHGKRNALAYVVVASLPFIVPYIDKYMESKSNATIELMITQSREKLITEIRTIVDDRFNQAMNYHNGTLINLDDVASISCMRNAVKAKSLDKIKWLRNYMSQYKHEELGKFNNRIRLNITAEFTRQSSIYISELNGKYNLKLGKLGNFIASNFPMKEFLDSVMEVLLDPMCDDMHNKIIDVETLMLEYQNQLWDKAEQIIKE